MSDASPSSTELTTNTPAPEGGTTTPPAAPAVPDTTLTNQEPPAPTSQTSWVESLPEELRSNERLTGFKSVEELAKAHADAKFAPTIPEPEAYNLPETVGKEFGEWAHKSGLTQEQVDSIFELHKTTTTQQQEAFENAQKQELDKLFETWGQEKDTNLGNAKRLIEHFDTDGKMRELLNVTRAGNNPIVVKFFAELGKQVMGEDGFIRSTQTQDPPNKSAAEIIFDGK